MSFAAGQRITANDLNDASLPGKVVFRTYSGAGQSVPTRTTEMVADAIVWDSPQQDDYGGWSSSTPTRWTCMKAGMLWTLSGRLSFNGSIAGTLRQAIWYINGALPPAGRAVPVASSAISNASLTVEAAEQTLPLNVGDFVELVPLQNTGGPLAVATGSYRPIMAITCGGPSS